MIKKSELYERIKYLEEENQRLTAKLESEQQIRRGKQIGLASNCFYNQIRALHGHLICNVKYNHVDEAGFWFTFELTNDNRKQTYVVRHEDLDSMEDKDATVF